MDPICLFNHFHMRFMPYSVLNFHRWDLNMYDPDTDCPAVARTTTLNEELGQIDYIFSDKTGTLTQNVMLFDRCSVGGTSYGGPMRSTAAPVPVGCEESLATALESGNPRVQEFFRVLGICHTVQVEEIAGRKEYKAQSPDEKALVEAADEAGFTFAGDTTVDLTLKVRGCARPEVYEKLNTIEFDSTRKRMSMILRCPDGTIKVFCKGADNIMLARLAEPDGHDAQTLKRHLTDFSLAGLRTLVITSKTVTEADYDEWRGRFDAAAKLVDNRDDALEELANEMERGLTLVGATAIEDKLQEGVPDAIATLKSAGIKLWVLTGDKLETAIEIGKSCRLLTDEMKPFYIVDGETHEEVETQLLQTKADMDRSMESPNHRPFALVITGPSLMFPLPPSAKELKEVAEDGSGIKWTAPMLERQRKLEDLFLEVSVKCRAVLCCRVSPLQKAKVVTLVKVRKQAICLAIGDGANDVSMIRAAHIGVGISGLEGRQAVLASDFSFSQFRFLKNLLLVHGRWSYFRMTAFLRYFFYKNFAFSCVSLWYGFYNGGSAQAAYDPIFISMFNVLFTSVPIMVRSFLIFVVVHVGHVGCLRLPLDCVRFRHQNVVFNHCFWNCFVPLF